MTRTTFVRPNLTLKTLYENRTPELNSPASLTSSIPTIFSPLTPEDNDQFVFSAKDAADDVFMSHIKPGEYVSRLLVHEDRTYLPPLSEVSSESDQDSIYSQDSACVVYTSKLRSLPEPNPSVTPKSTLTFAAIWDPDHGLSAFSNNKLIKQERPSRAEEEDPLDWMQEVEGNAYLASFYYSDHPDCEPHLASRFSTTTTSTSNYIEVDFGAEDERDFSASQRREREPGLDLDLLPGDIHPAWVPQIFTLGYTKPPSLSESQGSQRPEISEPFQLAPIRREELIRHNTFPSRSSGSKSYASLFSRSRMQSSTSYSSSVTATAASSKSANSSPTSSLQRGMSLGSSPSREGSWPSQSQPLSKDAPVDGSSGLSGDIFSSPDRRPNTPTRRPSRVGSVLERLKSPKKDKGQMDGSWILVDVQVTSVSTIQQRVVVN